jgi:hypothetical protein
VKHHIIETEDGGDDSSMNGSMNKNKKTEVEDAQVHFISPIDSEWPSIMTEFGTT